MRVVRVGEVEGSRPPGPEVLEPQIAERVAPPGSDAAGGLQLVLVAWHDAWFDSDQQSADEWRSDYLVHTVGFLVRESTTILSIAQEVLPDGDGFRAVTHIPVSTIESITKLLPGAPSHRRHLSADGHEGADGNGGADGHGNGNGRLHRPRILRGTPAAEGPKGGM